MKGQTNLWSKKKDKQLFTKHYTEMLNNTNPIKTGCEY